MSLAETEMQRAVDFLHDMEGRSYTRTERWHWGTAYFNDDFPIKWDLNYLRVETPTRDMTAELMVREADRLQAPAGLKHRKINVDEQALGEELAPQFKELGWIVQRLIFMALREPPAERPLIEVVEKTYDELYPIRMEAEISEYNNSEEDARMLTESRKVTASATNLRSLVGLLEGRIAGWGELYSDGRTAQIEDIGTFQRFRNRGVARAIVLKAIDITRAEGHDLFFLIADANDWPKELYRKLGFEPIGEIYEFLLRSK